MSNLAAEFEKRYGRPPVAGGSAPGRLEILGNHTDYNEGIVLSCAVDQHTSMVLAPASGTRCRVYDCREKSAVEFDAVKLGRAKPRDWGNYLRGLLAELQKRGVTVGGFDAVLESTVPLSAGMSSSAALEMSFAMALQQAFSLKIDRADWARIGQGVENNYLGLKSGLLDQFSSLYGARNALILSDFRTVKVLKQVQMPEGYVFVVANSMIKHNLVDSEYNTRRADCESAARKLGEALPGIHTLRDVTMSELEDHGGCLTPREFRRAAHVIGECERVRAAVAALERNDIGEFGALLTLSHRSSQRNFENSTPELDVLVDYADSSPLCLGARLSGGGFGGITIHLVATGDVAEYAEKLRIHYQKAVQKDPQIIVCAIGDGAHGERL